MGIKDRLEGLSNLHCPSCCSTLRQTESVDPFIARLECNQKHVFSVSLEVRTTLETEAATRIATESLPTGGAQQIILGWMRTPDLRSRLNPQLATILRNLYEQSLGAEKNLDYGDYRCCPICGESLRDFEQPDIWFRGVVCKNGHRFKVRGGSLYQEQENGDGGLDLHPEPSSSALLALIGAWIAKTAPLRDHIHSQLLQIFEAYLQQK